MSTQRYQYRVIPYRREYYQQVFDMVYDGTLEPWTEAYTQVKSIYVHLVKIVLRLSTFEETKTAWHLKSFILPFKPRQPTFLLLILLFIMQTWSFRRRPVALAIRVAFFAFAITQLPMPWPVTCCAFYEIFLTAYIYFYVFFLYAW